MLQFMSNYHRPSSVCRPTAAVRGFAPPFKVRWKHLLGRCPSTSHLKYFQQHTWSHSGTENSSISGLLVWYLKPGSLLSALGSVPIGASTLVQARPTVAINRCLWCIHCWLGADGCQCTHAVGLVPAVKDQLGLSNPCMYPCLFYRCKSL